MKQQYKIAEANVTIVNEMIEKVNKRAKKLNQPEISYVVDREYFEDITYNKDTITVKMLDITIQAEMVKVEGYKFLATLNHTYEAGNIIKTIGEDVVIPEIYKTIDGMCEHCNTNRKRKETVLLIDEQGEIKQIGKSCLKDYFGYDVHEQLKYMNLITEIENELTGYGSISDNIDGWKFAKYVDVHQLLVYANAIIKNYGYVKTHTEGATSTKERTLMLYHRSRMEYWDKKEIEIYNDCHDKEYKDSEVDEALEWIKEQEAKSDYIHNLKIIAENKHVNDRETGILVSLLPFYYKAKHNEEKKKEEINTINNEYVGKVGERKEYTLTLKNEFPYETEYGTMRIFIFEDTEHHQFKWNASNSMVNYENGKRAETGDTITLKGTIKEHSEYKEIKQTVLTRCKILKADYLTD